MRKFDKEFNRTIVNRWIADWLYETGCCIGMDPDNNMNKILKFPDGSTELLPPEYSINYLQERYDNWKEKKGSDYIYEH